MVVIRIKDNRYYNGYRIKFFSHAETITDEIIQFVKRNTRAYWVECSNSNEYYRSREEFLKAYTQ